MIFTESHADESERSSIETERIAGERRMRSVSEAQAMRTSGILEAETGESERSASLCVRSTMRTARAPSCKSTGTCEKSVCSGTFPSFNRALSTVPPFAEKPKRRIVPSFAQPQYASVTAALFSSTGTAE